MKKLLAIAILCGLMLTTFAACTNDGEGAETTAETTVAEGNDDSEETSGPTETGAIEVEETRTFDEALALSNEVLAKIDEGVDFDELIAEYGEDPGMETYPMGYVVTPGMMVAEFEEESYALEVDEISDEPVKTSYGYHIVQRLAADQEFYDANADELNYYYLFDSFNAEYEIAISSAEVTYKEDFYDITPLNVDDYMDSEGLILINGQEIPFDLFTYFFVAITSEVDLGDKTFWETEDGAAMVNEVKQSAIDYCIQYIIMEQMATSRGIDLTEEEMTAFEAELDSIIEQNGGEETFTGLLEEIYVSLDTYKRIGLITAKSDAIMNSFRDNGLPEGTTADQVIEYFNDTEESQLVRVKHVLISGAEPPAEETTTEASE